MTTYVYEFASGSKDMKDLLGGKGANRCEMNNLGLPVPPGFIVSTEACRHYLTTGQQPGELFGQIDRHLAGLEERIDRRFGDRDDPLPVSVRSGAKFSMPGMMETILDIGLTDHTVHGLAAHGEPGGDPDSIEFFAGAGGDYVSCSPFRVPDARLEAGRASRRQP